ncbi:EAL domain-containing protein [Arthrospira platensis]|uniref:EAL domain-containing protein n=1 Tax=Limnospira TaxID=2596745 RepID=UPI0001C3928B|nr:EAL domain-containing protein [Arthrospira platensis]KDR56042.1 diguanylate cyclase [Arthrospira platensis str. Paraca]MBD2667946.1 EAL domain-containing protein [Arthrospira platensis FACHB-439]MBD2708916.1 EAL domain-containing protein [Arthrospira platensis FACHB-835]MDT9309032.1 EAL domain-containing protein [Limnospira sp. Paracas R14]QQW29151.1 EAL domain-containing protein [Arthrospira sp. PCC 9108]
MKTSIPQHGRYAIASGQLGASLVEPLHRLIVSHQEWMVMQLLQCWGQTTKPSIVTHLRSVQGLTSRISLLLIEMTAGLTPEYLVSDMEEHLQALGGISAIALSPEANTDISAAEMVETLQQYRQCYLNLIKLGEFRVEQEQLFAQVVGDFFTAFDRQIFAQEKQRKYQTIIDQYFDGSLHDNINHIKASEIQRIFNAINIPILVLNQEHQVIFGNRKAHETLVVNSEIPSEIDTWLRKRSPQAATNQSEIVEEIAIAKDDITQWFCLKLYPMDSQDWGDLRAIAICEDITLRHRKAERQQLQQQHLEEVQALTKTGSWCLNMNTGEMIISDQLYHILGENPQNVSINFEDFLNHIYIDDLYSWVQTYSQSLFTQQNYRLNYRIIQPDSSMHWVSQQSTPVSDRHNKITHITSIIQEIDSHQIANPSITAEAALRESEARLRTIISTSTNGLVVVDCQGRALFINPAAEALFGRQARELEGEMIGIPLVTKESTELEIFRHDGKLKIVRMRVVEISWEQETAYLASLTDITDFKKTEDQLKMFSRACDQSPVSIVITDSEGDIQYVNPKFEEITGYKAAEVMGQNPRILKSGYTTEPEYDVLWKQITSGKQWSGEFHNKRKNGELFWEHASICPMRDEEGYITHFIAVKEDITQQKHNEEILAHQANYDALTDLPNRTLIFERLRQAIIQAQVNHSNVAVMFIDLDHFKNINDTLGHELGDFLLKEAGMRLKGCLRTTDTVGRLGGDEFLVIIPNLDDLIQAEYIATQVLGVLGEPFNLCGEEAFISASIGIASYPQDGNNASTLVRNADTGMYAAKQEGRNVFAFFTQNMNDEAQSRIIIENHLRHAINRDELSVVYQPFINLATAQIVGAEALMRWYNPELGNIRPDQFIAIAEESRLIVDLGEWILSQACQEVAIWHQQGNSGLWVAVNMSPRQLRTPNLVNVIIEAIANNGLSSDCLELEITERSLVAEVPGVQSLIKQLHSLKIRLAIDDFGTGYSSLSYLKRFPFSVLKIDKSFISDLPDDQDAIALVKTMITMAHGLGLVVVAEGIETSAQLDFLCNQGCDYGQGYLFSKPLPPAEFRAYLQKNS